MGVGHSWGNMGVCDGGSGMSVSYWCSVSDGVLSDGAQVAQFGKKLGLLNGKFSCFSVSFSDDRSPMKTRVFLFWRESDARLRRSQDNSSQQAEAGNCDTVMYVHVEPFVRFAAMQ
ncbi:hypothetical protein CBL_08780 [Carabus blaptoides fortunei]